MLRSLTCPLARGSLRRSNRPPRLAGLWLPAAHVMPRAQAKARRRLGPGRAPHWPAPRVTRPLLPRPRLRLQGSQCRWSLQVFKPQASHAPRGPPATSHLPPPVALESQRTRGSASKVRSPGEKVRKASGSKKNPKVARNAVHAEAWGSPGQVCPPSPLPPAAWYRPLRLPVECQIKLGACLGKRIFGEIWYGLIAEQPQLP